MNESIKKHKYQKNFTIVNNAYLQDRELSWKGKGLITYVMSLPEDWELNMADLKNRAKDGRDSVYSGIKELIENGYCRRLRSRDKGGQITGYSYEVADYKAFDPHTENPYPANPYPANPDRENPSLESTKKRGSTKVTKDEKRAPALHTGDLFPEQNPNKKTLFANSVYNDFQIFKSKFTEPEFANIDLSYYFNSVKDWSDSANKMRTARGWIATARSFMRGDLDKGKLKTLKIVQEKQEEDVDAIKYLRGDFE